jgi:hypothetical protein
MWPWIRSRPSSIEIFLVLGGKISSCFVSVLTVLLEEKLPPTNANLNSDNQQLEEKIPLNTNNDNNSSLPSADLDAGLKIKFTPDYDEKEPVFWRVIGELSNDGLVDYDKIHERLVSTDNSL